MGSWRNLAARLEDLGDWKDPDKCILASALTLPFVAMWIARLTLVRMNPSFGPYLDQGFLGPMLAFVWLQAAGHLSRRPVRRADDAHRVGACRHRRAVLECVRVRYHQTLPSTDSLSSA